MGGETETILARSAHLVVVVVVVVGNRRESGRLHLSWVQPEHPRKAGGGLLGKGTRKPWPAGLLLI